MKRAPRPDIPDMLRFLSHSGRREILIHLGSGPKTARDLCEAVDITPATVRAQLKQLCDWKLVRPVTRTRPFAYQLATRVRVLFLGDRAALEIRDLPSGQINLTFKRCSTSSN